MMLGIVTSQTEAGIPVRRLRRVVRRTILVSLVVVVGATCAVAIAAPRVRTQARASGAKPVCTKFLSTSTVTNISGLSTKPYGVVKYPKKFGVPDGGDHRVRIPGSICQWIDDPEPSGGLANTASLLVGYGETRAGWSELVAYFRAGAPDTGYPDGFSDMPAYSPLHLGYGSKAFLITVNLADYYKYTPGPGLPNYLYAVTVLTKRHNVLQVWFINASAAATEAWAVSILKHRASSF